AAARGSARGWGRPCHGRSGPSPRPAAAGFREPHYASRPPSPLRADTVSVYECTFFAGRVRRRSGPRYGLLAAERKGGSGVRVNGNPGIDQLCGACANGRLAIDPSGNAYPCVFARWLPLGNIREVDLSTVARSDRLADVRAHLEEFFAGR